MKMIKMAFYSVQRLLYLVFFLGLITLFYNWNTKNELVPNELHLTLPTNSTTLNNITINCCTGRIGNQMFIYAALYGISKASGRQGLTPKCVANFLEDIFDLTLPVIEPSKIKKGYPVDYSYKAVHNLQIPTEANTITGSPYKNSIRFWSNAIDEIKNEFKFKKSFLEPIQKYLAKLKVSSGFENPIFIGVHVRRGDYIKMNYLKDRKLQAADVDYFKMAFDYFRKKFENAIFVVASDDINWCVENFKWPNTYFQSNSKWNANQDLALLSRCNHSIIDYGTFGWWGAFLAGGETIFYANAPNKGSYIKDEFYLPEWIDLPKRI